MSTSGFNYTGIGLFGFNEEMKINCYIRIQIAAGANTDVRRNRH